MNKATGITRPVKGEKEWVELWVGDIIKCRVYITDREGCYFWIDEAEVFWEKDYGQYSIRAKYTSHGKKVDGIFALREVLRRNMEFIKKVPRELGNQGEIILAIIDILRTHSETPVDISDHKGNDYVSTDIELQDIANTLNFDMLDTIAGEIGKMGIVPKDIVNEVFYKNK